MKQWQVGLLTSLTGFRVGGEVLASAFDSVEVGILVGESLYLLLFFYFFRITIKCRVKVDNEGQGQEVQNGQVVEGLIFLSFAGCLASVVFMGRGLYLDHSGMKKLATGLASISVLLTAIAGLSCGMADGTRRVAPEEKYKEEVVKPQGESKPERDVSIAVGTASPSMFGQGESKPVDPPHASSEPPVSP